MLVAALVLYVFRHVVQDKLPMKLREEVPATPEEQLGHPELARRRPRRYRGGGLARVHAVRVLALADKPPPLAPA